MRRVPNHLQVKVIKWFDYLWLSQKCSDEERAVSCLPDKLKVRITFPCYVVQSIKMWLPFLLLPPGLLLLLLPLLSFFYIVLTQSDLISVFHGAHTHALRISCPISSVFKSKQTQQWPDDEIFVRKNDRHHLLCYYMVRENCEQNEKKKRKRKKRKPSSGHRHVWIGYTSTNTHTHTLTYHSRMPQRLEPIFRRLIATKCNFSDHT